MRITIKCICTISTCGTSIAFPICITSLKNKTKPSTMIVQLNGYEAQTRCSRKKLKNKKTWLRFILNTFSESQYGLFDTIFVLTLRKSVENKSRACFFIPLIFPGASFLSSICIDLNNHRRWSDIKDKSMIKFSQNSKHLIVFFL